MNNPEPDSESTSSFPLLIKILTVILLGVLSFTFFADMAMDVDTHSKTIASIDEKKETVLALTATATLTSVVVSAGPDDTATPISQKLADISNYFLIVLCTLYAEKYLLTLLGFVSFRILIPLACICIVISMIARKRLVLRNIGIKVIVCALLAYAAIPVSIWISNMIDTTYSESINNTIQEAESYNSKSKITGEENDSIIEKITGTASMVIEKASSILSSFIEALAVMIVTSCIIPILVLLFFVWLVKKMTGISIPVPKQLAKHAAVGAADGDHALPEGK